MWSRGYTLSRLSPHTAQPSTLADPPHLPGLGCGQPIFALSSLPYQWHPPFMPVQTAVCWWWNILTWFKHLRISICFPLISVQKLDPKLLLFFFYPKSAPLTALPNSMSRHPNLPVTQVDSWVPSLALFFISWADISPVPKCWQLLMGPTMVGGSYCHPWC